MSETHKKSEAKQQVKQPEVKEKEETLDRVESEMETFCPQGGEVKLPSLNKHFEIKKFTWGKEAVLGKMLGTLLKDSNFGEFRKLTEENIQGNPQIVIDTFLPILESAPETITKMVGTILDKENKWVEDNLQIEDIVEVLVPFFIGAFKRYQNLYGKINQRFQKR